MLALLKLEWGEDSGRDPVSQLGYGKYPLMNAKDRAAGQRRYRLPSDYNEGQ
jgi:hypothetical protein